MKAKHRSQVIQMIPELKSLKLKLSIKQEYMYTVTQSYSRTTHSALVRYLNLPFISNNNYGDEVTQLVVRPRSKTYTVITTDPRLISRLSNLSATTESVLLSEMKRPQLVNKIRKDTKQRYKRRQTIEKSDVRYKLFDVFEFMYSGKLVLNLQVRSYDITIEVDGVLDYLKKSLKSHKRINYKLVHRYLSWSLDNNDIRINCTCPDFQYRFAYVATKGQYKSHSPESRPATKTNPNSTGAGCKHIAYILGNKTWIRKYVSAINTILKVNPDLLK